MVQLHCKNAAKFEILTEYLLKEQKNMVDEKS
jgi:hypothetical protein